ncbi:hypothetical protein EPUL_001831 [Erysiphe pulchra]|uniref:Reverse transcriptase domain-containing protein n=1 Tax=Erysiphe pulchra TaxID=225359 RepID=A0A2S4PZ07_9PEZI|nr:hypothetical protein EPUL_001831 [Erysiphe pulchra]
MSPPATPMRAPLSPSPLITTHPPRPRTKRFLNTNSTTFASQKSVDLSEDPFHSSTNSQDSTSERQDTLAVSPGNYLTKATEEACNEARRIYFKRESIAREYSKALDEVSGRLRELGLGDLTKSVEAEIALILQQFAKGEKRLGSSQSEFYLIYAQFMRASTSGNPTATLPKKPTTAPIKEKIRTQKPDNRIFIRLLEEHASRSHHVYAVKAALTSRLNLEHGSLKTVQKVNSGFAIVPNNDKQAEELLSKANLFTNTIGGTVEKGEEWHTYVVENVPRSLMSLDGKRWNVTEENAREEILAVTGTMPTKVAWSRKTLDNPATTGTIVACFKNSTPPFRLFCTSSLARKIFKSQKKADELVEWTQAKVLGLISPIDKSTHVRGSTLDLAFTNILGTQCNIEECQGTYTYADEIAFLRTGQTLSQCTEKLFKDLESVTKWGKNNAISFDPDKSDLQHFTQAPKPKEYPNLSYDNWNISPNQITRWLGIWLDRKLTFLTHVSKWIAKASAVASHIKRLNNTQRGSRLDLVRQAVKACVISTAMFGAEVWWPGDTVISWNKDKYRELKHRSGSHIALLTKTINQGLRAILPAQATFGLSAVTPSRYTRHDIHLYTDGSYAPDGKAGGATPSTSSANKNVRLVSIGLDYPDHEGNLSDCELPYDDPPHQPGKIEEALLSTSEAASQRILAAQTLFCSISNVLDLQCQSNNEHMHANDIRALNDLCEEFRAVAKRHFEAYVRGTSPCAKNKEDTMPTQNNSYRKGNTPSSYAQAASPNTHLPHRVSTNSSSLPEDDQLRTLSGYALQSPLKSKLGPDGHLLANTLPTKTGNSIRQAGKHSGIKTINEMGINTLNGQPIERVSPWKSYRITNVPRRYGVTAEEPIDPVA